MNALYSALLWAVGGLHFAAGAAAMALAWLAVGPRRAWGLERAFCRAIVRLAGARLEVRTAAGAGAVGRPGRGAGPAGFFVCNHVNLFDPFVLAAVLPVFARGLELESHFRIPVYGWLMRLAGNVPVPDVKTSADLRRMWRSAEEALRSGTSLVVFPEGARTRDGDLRRFHDGVFRMALRFGVPVVPVTIAGAFAWNNKLSWRLRPARVVVTLHAAIDAASPGSGDAAALRDRARAAVASALDAA